MKKLVPFLAMLTFLGCKEEVVKKPKHLIERDQMVNIMYDLSLLEAIKYQNPAVLDSNQIRPKQFIYAKYKIDSLQLAQNNVYYASDYKNYKIMFDEVTKRIESDKKKALLLSKIEAKKNKARLEKLKKT
ncbi:MAG: hypothetical protein RLZZ44_1651 [Bacteroidota bacterium]